MNFVALCKDSKYAMRTARMHPQYICEQTLLQNQGPIQMIQKNIGKDSTNQKCFNLQITKIEKNLSDTIGGRHGPPNIFSWILCK